jgi:putative SOS response-associated peptidase YedK
MLTTAPGPDVAPYHDRQVAVLAPADWLAWLGPAAAATTRHDYRRARRNALSSNN